jgi:hypothetical protein
MGETCQAALGDRDPPIHFPIAHRGLESLIPESQPIAAADGHPAAMQCVRRTARFVTGGSRVPRDLPMILASFITLQRSDVKLSLHNERRHVRDGWKAALFVLAAMACFAVVGLIGHRLPQALKPSRRAPS